MAIYVVTGKLGAGKTLMSVSRIQLYLNQNRKVATNLDINLSSMIGNYAKKSRLYRIPDIPTIESLEALPLGYDSDEIDESKNGLLVLDECGIFLNSRGWNDPKRKPINAFFKLLRKKRWDAIFIIQDIDNLDSDAKRTIAEHVVYCRRLDRMSIPIITPLLKGVLGIDLPMPQLHLGIVRYGTEKQSIKVDQWNYYGNRLYDAYDTEQLFSETENYNFIDGICTVLPPYYTHGRYTSKLQDFKNALKNHEIKSFHFFLLGLVIALFFIDLYVTFAPEQPRKGLFSCNEQYEHYYGSCSSKPIIKPEFIKDLKLSDSVVSTSKFPEQFKPGFSQSVQAKKPVDDKLDLYISGWLVTTNGIQMYFVDSLGKPFYPSEYKVLRLGDCSSRVLVDGSIYTLKCMPDDMAYNYPLDSGSS